MVSTFSARLRIDYQAPGDNINTWGTRLNTAVFQLLEDAVSLRTAFALSGTKILTTANGATDEARSMMLDVTSGSGGTIQIPEVSKIYVVRVASGVTGDVVVDTAAVASHRTATVKPGNICVVMCNGADCDLVVERDLGAALLTTSTTPTLAGHLTRKAYVDAGDAALAASLATEITNRAAGDAAAYAAAVAYTNAVAWSYNAGSLPAMSGQPNPSFVFTDGSTAAWGYTLANQAENEAMTSALRLVTPEGVGWAIRKNAAIQRVAVTSGATTIGAAHANRLVAYGGAASYTSPLTAAATLGSSWSAFLFNSTALVVTIDPAGADTIDGAATLRLLPRELRLVTSDGVSAFDTVRVATANDPGPMIFGDGSDGDVTVTGAVTLTRDMAYRNLTVSGAGSINAAGFRVFVSEVLDLTAAGAAALYINGGAGGVGTAGAVSGGGAAGAAGAAAGTAGTTGAGVAGGLGGAGATTGGSNGAAGTAGLNGGGGAAGGAGGLGTSGSGGSGGAAATTTAVAIPVLRRNLTTTELGSTLATGGAGGSGGGGGGGTVGGDFFGGGGGGGGGSGGVLQVFARYVARGASTAAGALQAKGGAGGAGGVGAPGGNAGGGAGGSGAGGGWVELVCLARVGAAKADAVDVTGGASGAGGAASTGASTARGGGTGGTGAGGRFRLWDLSVASPLTDNFGIAAKAAVAAGATAGVAAQSANVAQYSL